MQVSSGVQIKDVTFKNIRGTSRTEAAVNLQCSKDFPCRDVKLIDINLVYNGRPSGRLHLHGNGHERMQMAKAMCSNVIGSFSGAHPPGCVTL